MSHELQSSPRANRLARETSPYLLEHAHQPVDWYPWGAEALERARRENKPLLISIGYSACHWCHVMARESFCDEAIAQLINENFVAVKVDREERPDVDAVYMNVCTALNGSGGWPLTVFTTPDLQPIFAGTYFPPEDSMGRPGFRSLLTRIATLWRDDPARLSEQARTLGREVQELLGQSMAAAPRRSADMIALLVRSAQSRFDSRHGGFGDAPKFPQESLLRALLAIGACRQEPAALEMVRRSLDAMMYGGIYDQLEGGFARYCVDADWTVPHFEKMLYTQALLVPVYADAALVFGSDEYRRVVRETADWVLRRMRSPQGGFFAALDADSEGEEGRFYVWTRQQMRDVLGNADADFAAVIFDLGPHPNFEDGRDVLRRAPDVAAVARRAGLSADEALQRTESIRSKLRAVRGTRVAPATDDKIITGWNALMISALVRAAQVLEEPRYLEAARQAASFLTTALRPAAGTLLRVYCKGRAAVPAMLEDYAFLTAALIDLYETTGEAPFLNLATQLADEAVGGFVDPPTGRVFSAAADPMLIYRPEDYIDGAIPSAPVALLASLIRLEAVTRSSQWSDVIAKIRAQLEPRILAMPVACPTFYHVIELHEQPLLCELRGSVDDPDHQQLHRAIAKAYSPARVIRFVHASGTDAHAELCVCSATACLPPVRTPAELEELLRREKLAII
jgi:uncharacterized protein YyaL (SSP411 family)